MQQELKEGQQVILHNLADIHASGLYLVQHYYSFYS